MYVWYSTVLLNYLSCYIIRYGYCIFNSVEMPRVNMNGYFKINKLEFSSVSSDNYCICNKINID